MNVTYFIQLFDDQLQDCNWLRFNERTPAGQARQGKLTEILTEAASSRLVLILPAASVVLHKASIVAKSKSQIMAALPYALEDELANDIEQMHFAYRTIDRESGNQLVAVVDRDLVERLHALITRYQFESVLLLPQILMVPWQADNWSLFVQREQALLRKDLSAGYAMDLVAMPELLTTERELYKQQHESESAPELNIYNFSPDQEVEGGSHLGGDSEALAVMARYWIDNPDTGINLFQGEYQIVRPMRDLLRQWSMAAGIAVIALVIYLMNVAVDNYLLARERDGLEASMQSLYETVFNEKPAGNPADNMRKKLVALGSESGDSNNFISVILVSGKEFLADSQTSITRLRYTGNDIEVDLETTSIEQLEKLQQKLIAASVRAELKAVSNDNGKVRGRLVVSRNGENI
ncbi:MAG: type II secretion system protein GspL [Gammaproteobacteria bacterium]